MRSFLSVCAMCCATVHARGMATHPDHLSGGAARVTICVVDEEGNPVAEAKVGGHFQNWVKPDYVGDIYSQHTDGDGRTVVTGRAYGYMRVHASKPGHYRSEIRLQYPDTPTTLHRPMSWPDWVATHTVVLKRIRNPVPMYVKTATITIPGEEATVAYDLVKGDWLAPHGSGSSTDMVFQVAGEYLSFTERRVDLHVSVPGEFNGLLVSREPLTWDRRPTSELRSAHEAPTEGYSHTWTYRTSRSGNTVVNPSVTDSGVVFYFRIRSEFDELGELRRALYGKIYGHIMADHDEYLPNRPRNVMIQFTYYLNPDGTRNVEFDPDQNLFRLIDSGGNPLRFAP